MTCVRSFLTSAAPGVACIALVAMPLSAQVPVPMPPASPSAQPASLAPYRAPGIALVQPLATTGGAGSVPQDRPVVVFRYAAGEPDDPLDVGSFAVAVDGDDRTALFQATATQAWGPLVAEDGLKKRELATGAHRVTARICSTRGACTTTEAQVLVVPGLASVSSAADLKRSLARRALEALGDATRRILLP